MNSSALQKWEYMLVDVDYLTWDAHVRHEKERRHWRLDPQLDWRELVGEHEGAWVALDPHTNLRRPRLTVLEDLGAEGWDLSGVQLGAMPSGGALGWWGRPSSSFVLKRPLLDAAAR